MVKRTKSGKTKQHRSSKRAAVIDAIVAAAGLGPAAEEKTAEADIGDVKDNVAEKGGDDDDDANLKQPPEELNPPPLPPPLPNDNNVAAAGGSVAAPALPPITVVTNSNINLGISESALLAPVTLPPKKKRKQQDEFTIAQKLAILKELEGPNPPKIPALAAKHNTSRTSIYRWKNDEARLNVLLRRDGKGSSKRVSKDDDEFKVKRKSYNEEYTAAEKLAVVRELKKEGGPSVKDLADKVGANHRSVYRWKRDEERLAKLVEQEGKGDCKRSGGDPLHRVKEALKAFHAHHVASVAAGATTQALTGTIIAVKAKQIKDDMLAQNNVTPFLSEEEVKAMTDFTASTSWGRKIVQKYGWNEGSPTRKKNTKRKKDEDAATDAATAPVDKEGTVDNNDATAYASKHEKAIAEAETFDKIASAHAKAVAEVEAAKANPPKPSPQKRIGKTLTMAKKREMTKEINALKKKLKKADKRVEELEAENRTLKLQLSATLVNVGRGAASAANANDDDGHAVVLGENLADAFVEASYGSVNNGQVEGATTQV